MTAKFVSILRENNGTKYSARVDQEPKFFVGNRVHFQDKETLRIGLANASGGTGIPVYDPAQHRARHGFWADFIFPTVRCESRGIFHCINTYDRAFFTFSFLQYAAHVPDGDFIRFFRRLLGLTLAADYFPDLMIKDGAVFRITQAGAVRLETPQTTEPLMKYLNPTTSEVEDIKAINAAKFIHWCDNDPQHQALQVDVGVEHFREAMKVYAKLYSLDGRGDKVCLVVADIRHQGRAKSADIISALNTAGDDERAYKNLLEFGKVVYPQRIATLKAEVAKSEAAGILGRRKYSVAEGDFVST